MNLFRASAPAEKQAARSGVLARAQISEDLRYTNRVLYPFLVIGLVAVLAHLGATAEAATALLWVLAGLISGTAIGFLFGIPKILQSDSPPDNTANGKPADRRGYRQQVNTNLTEISDWLTKIIVGLGLINLENIPPYISRMGDVVASGLNSSDPAGEKSFALAIVVCFPVLGFFFGYLYTRLFLAGAFSRADQDATESEIRKVVEAEAQAVSNADLADARHPTERQLEAAGKVAQLAAGTDTSVVRQQLVDLAHEYERIRAVMPPGDIRTRKMEVVVTKMRTLALAAYPLLNDFANSPSPGERLAAVTMLEVKPNPEYLPWLAQRVTEEKPFVSYHAAVALLVAVRVLGASKREEIQDAIKKSRFGLGELLKGSDRDKILETALNELGAPSAAAGA